jgi:MFS family permease
MKRLHYGWVMVIGAIPLLAVQALTFYSFGIFIRPITQQFNWERGALSIAISLTMLVSGPLSIIAGRLSDKYGPRLLLTASGFLTGIGFLLMSRISELWHVYLIFGSIIAIGNSASVVPLTTAIPRWFEKKRGMALGLTWTGIGLGGVTGPLLSQWLIDTFDWRWAYVTLGIADLVIFIPLAQLMRRDPAQIGLKPYGAEDDSGNLNPLSSAEGVTFQQALKSAHFWLTGMVLFCLVFIGQIIINHLPPHAMDIGIPATVAASFISLYATTSLVGRNLCGFITDRIGARWMMLIGFVLISTSLVWLLFASEIWMFYLFASLYGISFGLIVPLQTLMPGELFGLKSLGIITATMMFMGSIGGAIGSPLAGAIFDATGDYQNAFFICAGFAALAIILGIILLRIKIKKV